MAEAIQYALDQWSELNVFSTDGAVPIDNNVSERERKGIVLHRKNSLAARSMETTAKRAVPQR